MSILRGTLVGATLLVVASCALLTDAAEARNRGKRQTFELYPGVDARKLKRSLIVPGHRREVRVSGRVRDVNVGQRWVVIKSKKYGTWKVYISSNADLRHGGHRLAFGLLGRGAYISVVGRQAGPKVIAARHVIAHSGILRIQW
ncbi:MAG: hypothetical protein ACE5O2_03315 [Armatimonadota bacterium]